MADHTVNALKMTALAIDIVTLNPLRIKYTATNSPTPTESTAVTIPPNREITNKAIMSNADKLYLEVLRFMRLSDPNMHNAKKIENAPK